MKKKAIFKKVRLILSVFIFFFPQILRAQFIPPNYSEGYASSGTSNALHTNCDFLGDKKVIVYDGTSPKITRTWIVFS